MYSLKTWFRIPTTVILFVTLASPVVNAASAPKVGISSTGGVTFQFANLSAFTPLIQGISGGCQSSDSKLLTVTNSGSELLDLELTSPTEGIGIEISPGVQEVFRVSTVQYCTNLEVGPVIVGTTVSGTVNIQ